MVGKVAATCKRRLKVTDFAMIHRPTLSQRLARRLGFRFTLGEEPDGVENMPGWARTTVRMEFDILDRLRILVGGRIHVDLTHYTDKPFDVMKSRTDTRIPAPWSE